MVPLVSLLALLMLGAPPTVEPRDIDAYLRQHLADADIPGLAVAVVRGADVVHRFTAGTDGDGRPVTARTPFLLGSVSKPFTALAVQQLAEVGRIDLHAPVRRYLPWFRLADERAAARITVWQLLTHTSGLPRRAVRTDRFDNTHDGLAAAVRELAAVTPEAERYRYSDANYLVLGALVAQVGGQPFGPYLREHVLDPLDMRHSAATEAEAAGIPAGHRYYFGQPQRFDAPFDTSGVPYGYLAASLDDLTHFVTAQLRGGRYRNTEVLSPQGIDLAHRSVHGLGWVESTLDGTGARMVWKAGADPGYFAHLVLLPEADLGVIVLSNVYSPAMDGVLASAAFNVARILHGVAPKPASADPALSAARVGLVGLAGLLLIAVAGSIVRAGRGQRRSRVRVLAGLGGWLAGCGIVTAGALVLPSIMGADLSQALLWTPDVGHGIVAVVVLAATLALTRLVIAAAKLGGGTA